MNNFYRNPYYRKRIGICLIVIVSLILLFVILGFLFREKSNDIKIVIPTSSRNTFIYSSNDIKAKKKKIKIIAKEGLSDCQVIIKSTDENKKNEKIEYITSGMPVVFEVEKDVTYKIGVNMKNETPKNIEAFLSVINVEVLDLETNNDNVDK